MAEEKDRRWLTVKSALMHSSAVSASCNNALLGHQRKMH